MCHLGGMILRSAIGKIPLFDCSLYNNISGALFSLARPLSRREIMNIWHDMCEKRIRCDDFFAVIEIEKGSKVKYELDKKTGMLLLDRILYTSTHYPASYGFIPRTYADDGDPLDVLVLCTEPIAPLSLVQVYPIGVITMIDCGNMDEKIIAIPFGDPTYNCYRSIDALPNHIFSEMRHFFKVYKELENKQTAVNEVKSQREAVEIVQKAIDMYKTVFGKEKN